MRTVQVATQSTNERSTTRLNVLHLLSSSGYYGAERWVVALANNLNRTEVNCELAVMYDGAGPPTELVENFPAPIADQYHFYQRSKFDPTVIWKLRKLIKQHSIDIICSHGYKSDLVALPAARLAGIRCVSTPHGFGSGLSWKMRMYIRLGIMGFVASTRSCHCLPCLCNCCRSKVYRQTNYN